jgi:glycosyltransferase involved in cell wall biosynthesis
MAVAGRGHWSVTAAAPVNYPGDLRPIALERFDGEESALVGLGTRVARVPHLMLYRGLKRLLDQPWDLIHCWEEPYVASSIQIAERAAAEARFVFATFQNIAKDYPFPFSTFERRVLRRASGWIAFGKTTHAAQVTRDARYGSLPSRIISPGVDASAFAPAPMLRDAARASLGWTDDVPVVGFVGRLVAAKGIHVLLDALSRTHVPWRALFVGDGPERTAIEAFGQARPGRLQIITNAAHDAVPRWMNAMDVLCAPSQSTPRWREQFGRMLIEAMSCGVPVIASDSGEIPHVVGDAAVVVGEAIADEWTAAIERLLTNPDLRQQYARRGRERAIEHFAWPAVAAAHLRFFEELS